MNLVLKVSFNSMMNGGKPLIIMKKRLKFVMNQKQL